MKNVSLIILLVSSMLLISCSDDEAAKGTVISVTIDGTAYAFSCFRNQGSNGGGYEYSVSCEQHSAGESKRLSFNKAYDVNGGELKVTLTDVPDITLFDSPYGINYECSNTGGITCSTSAVPTFNTTSTAMSLTDVVLPFTNNRTAENGTYVQEVTSHTMTTSIVLNSVPYFQ